MLAFRSSKTELLQREAQRWFLFIHRFVADTLPSAHSDNAHAGCPECAFLSRNSEGDSCPLASYQQPPLILATVTGKCWEPGDQGLVPRTGVTNFGD